MNNLRSNIAIFFLVVVALTTSTGIVNAQKAEKQISKEYKISEGYLLGISNKYGEINLVNWDRNHLSVEVIITTEATSQSKAEELLNAIAIDVAEKTSEVHFTTKIDSKKMSGNNKMSVVYKVKVPSYINVDLAQSYGNVFIQDISGMAEIVLKYGNLTANSLAASGKDTWNTMDLAYGKAAIDHVNAMNINIQYSELSIDDSEVLSIESTYSKFSLGKIVNLDFQSKYDKLFVDVLEGSMTLESDYTQVSVGTISNQFKEIYAEMTYGNFKAGLDKNCAFNIDAKTEYGSISIPEGDYQFSREGVREMVRGNIGGNSDSVLEADIRYGNLLLK
jgi:hypothetical protein